MKVRELDGSRLRVGESIVSAVYLGAIKVWGLPDPLYVRTMGSVSSFAEVDIGIDFSFETFKSDTSFSSVSLIPTYDVDSFKSATSFANIVIDYPLIIGTFESESSFSDLVVDDGAEPPMYEYVGKVSSSGSGATHNFDTSALLIPDGEIILFVQVTNGSANPPTITTLTVDGVAASFITEHSATGSGASPRGNRGAAYRAPNPGQGTIPVVLALSGACTFYRINMYVLNPLRSVLKDSFQGGGNADQSDTFDSNGASVFLACGMCRRTSGSAQVDTASAESLTPDAAYGVYMGRDIQQVLWTDGVVSEGQQELAGGVGSNYAHCVILQFEET